MNERTIMILMGILTAGFAGITAFSCMTGDHTAPEIQFPDAQITYTEGSDTQALLEGVTAQDDKNGDVSDYVCIDNIIPNPEDGTATVVYAAYDFSNNVAKVKRTVAYIPAKEDEVTADTEAGAVETDASSEDASETLAEGSSADALAEESDEAEEVVDPKAPVLTMAEHAFTIEEGGPFTPKNRVLRVEDDVDSSDQLMRNLKVDGDYDINKAGVYELDYYVVDSEGRESNHEKMVLTVETAGNAGNAGNSTAGNNAGDAGNPAAGDHTAGAGQEQ